MATWLLVLAMSQGQPYGSKYPHIEVTDLKCYPHSGFWECIPYVGYLDPQGVSTPYNMAKLLS